MKKLVQYTILTAITLSVISLISYAGYCVFENRASNYLTNYLISHMPEENKRLIYEQMASNISNFWDVIPEPLVARIGRINSTSVEKGAEVRINNAGMRSHIQFLQKKPNEFRIIFLGDSFVYGTAGKEKDRFTNQIDDYYKKNNITVNNKKISCLALGIGSWTTVQEATYLSSRISSYDPDIIILLTVPNDITSSQGVTGIGAITNAFSPEFRSNGSGVFSNQAGLTHGVNGFSALTFGLSPESEKMWDKAFKAIRALVKIQKSRDKHILLSALDWGPPQTKWFLELYNYYGTRLQINAPSLITSYYPMVKKNRLPHDDHPSKVGHSILASHYINALDKLGWIKVPTLIKPEIDPKLSLDLDFNHSPERLDRERRGFSKFLLRKKLDFNNLSDTEVRGLLGGIVPSKKDDPDSKSNAPWASVRSGFLLREKSNNDNAVELLLELSPKKELFPLNMEFFINGHHAKTLTFSTLPENLMVQVILPLGKVEEETKYATEIIIETDSYFCTIDDPFMKSYKIHSAKLSFL